MSDRPSPAFSLSEVHKSFRKGLAGKPIRALRGVSFAGSRGEVTCLLGPNGSGKSTSIRLLLGLTRPDSGQVLALEADPGGSERARIGYLPEAPWFPSHLKGTELLALSGALYRMPQARIRERSSAVIEAVRLGEAAERPLRTYSKGMLQKIGIAQALLHEPDLVILDEPSAGLDPLVSREISALIEDVRAAGRSVLLCTHDLEQAARLGDRFILLHSGRVAATEGPSSGTRLASLFDDLAA